MVTQEMKSVLFEDATLFVRREFDEIFSALSPYKKETEGDVNKPKIFGKHIHTFLFCALLAEKNGLKTSSEDFASFKKKDLIRTQSFDSKDKAAYLAVAYKTDSFSLEKLHSAEKMKNELELYADAGMEFLIDNCLKDFVIETTVDGVKTRSLDSHMKKYNIEKAILSFIKNEKGF